MSNDQIFSLPNEWLTTGQAARALKLAPGTLQNWRTKGKGPGFIKRDNNVFYPREAIEAYLKEICQLYQSTAQWKEQKDRG